MAKQARKTFAEMSESERQESADKWRFIGAMSRKISKYREGEPEWLGNLRDFIVNTPRVNQAQWMLHKTMDAVWEAFKGGNEDLWLLALKVLNAADPQATTWFVWQEVERRIEEGDKELKVITNLAQSLSERGYTVMPLQIDRKGNLETNWLAARRILRTVIVFHPNEITRENWTTVRNTLVRKGLLSKDEAKELVERYREEAKNRKEQEEKRRKKTQKKSKKKGKKKGGQNPLDIHLVTGDSSSPPERFNAVEEALRSALRETS